jgi:DNA polymerase III alpha subunit
MYAELHCHSHYSLLDGATAPEALAARAAELGLPALALTDHDGLYGAVAFWRAARTKGIQPIIGAELTLAHGSHLTLLAENQTGYANLSRLLSRGQLAGRKGHPLLTIEEVAQHTAGLLCLTGCRRGAVAQAVLADDPHRAARAAGKLADIFGRERVWIELQRHWLPEDGRLGAGLVAAAGAAGLPVVATNNVRYATPAGQPLHDLLTATRLGCSLGELTSRLSPLEAAAQASAEFYLKSAAEMAALFADRPAALRATLAIAERCRTASAPVSLDFSARRTPAFPSQSADFPYGRPTGETTFSYLYALAHAGLSEIDLLCLRTLDAISEACNLIAARTGQAPDLAVLPLDDPRIYAMLAAGDTIGAFQVESRAQAQMLPRLKPARFEDLVIQVAIVRPGPIQGGMVHPYLRRRQGLEPVTYLHPSLEPFLAETLGVVIFQEQVLQVAMALARFTPGEADMLRRAMSRSRSMEAMTELKDRFMQGALANGVAENIAEEAFRQLQGFATYGFCKSHAAAFALLAYQTLWLKLYHPLEFTCALLNHQPLGFYSPEVVIGDAQRHGVTVLRPDVNHSQNACTLEDKSLRLGLRYLHGLGEAGIARILAARGEKPFASPSMDSGQALGDFCRRTKLPRPLIGDLIRAGALDSCQTPEPAIGRSARSADGRRRLLWQLGEMQYAEEQLVEVPVSEAALPELSDGEAFAWDYELLGLTPGDHPLRLWRPRLQRQGVLTAAELNRRPAGQRVQTAGLVVVRQAPPTAKGHLFITLEDETGLANLIIRPEFYERERQLLRAADLLLVTGVTQRSGQASSLLVQEAVELRA